MGTLTPVFVGNAPKDVSPQPAVAGLEGGRAFALVTLPDDAARMGMFAIAIDDPPKLDEPSTWSPYPSPRGRLAVSASRGSHDAIVARARASDDDAGAHMVLELGRIDRKSGAFESFGAESLEADARELAIAEDDAGDARIYVAQRNCSFLEPRRCR
jgi:hypothetical protein